jgi:hypothetical protein
MHVCVKEAEKAKLQAEKEAQQVQHELTLRLQDLEHR